MALYEKLNFNYVTKSIPISNKSKYKLKLLDKVKKFKFRLRIKLYFCIDKTYNINLIENKETYGFKSKFIPKLTDELRRI